MERCVGTDYHTVTVSGIDFHPGRYGLVFWKVEEDRAILRVSLPSSTARLSQSEAQWSAIAELANSVCIAWPQVSDGTNHQADLRRLVVLNLK